MKKSRFTEEQIIHALRRSEAGEPVKEIVRDIRDNPAHTPAKD